MALRSVSARGLALIRKFEGFRPEPAPVREGGWVVGYGHLRIAAPGEGLTEAEARALLLLDLAPVEICVNASVTRKLSQAQFDALVSFAFSIGIEAFVESVVLRRVNAGAMTAAACAMEAWRLSDASGALKVSGALVRRRSQEKAMFLREAPNSAAATPLVRPQHDQNFHPAPPANPAKRLTEILRAEPATAAMLLAPPAAEEPLIEEIVTAHAKPVARAALHRPVWRPDWRALMTFRDPVTTIGLGSLLCFGLALVALGFTMLTSPPIDVVDVVCALVLAAPGGAATLMAIHGLWRAPRLIEADNPG